MRKRQTRHDNVLIQTHERTHARPHQEEEEEEEEGGKKTMAWEKTMMKTRDDGTIARNKNTHTHREKETDRLYCCSVTMTK